MIMIFIVVSAWMITWNAQTSMHSAEKCGQRPGSAGDGFKNGTSFPKYMPLGPLYLFGWGVEP